MVRKSFSDDYQKLDMMLIIFKYFWRGKTRIQIIWNMEMHKCRGSLVGYKIFISNKFSGNEMEYLVSFEMLPLLIFI